MRVEQVDESIACKIQIGGDSEQAMVPVVVHGACQIDEGRRQQLAAGNDPNAARLLGDQEAAVRQSREGGWQPESGGH
jgi:hypothetical protein